ncbi:MAG: MerR family transcriptional regulator [Ignavibacteria bacterium]|nr:MerR family transcriptional regulator [Ignavibacteria bacterium]
MSKNPETPVFTISTAATLLGISIPTLRMYEKEGLIVPFKKESNQRLYSQTDLDRIRCIRETINKDKISIAGIKRILSMIPCWDILRCTEQDRINCLAFKEHTNPCWDYNHTTGICGTKNCRECDVYLNFAECSKIKSHFISITLNRNS